MNWPQDNKKKEKAVELKSIKPEHFNIYLNWLLNQKLLSPAITGSQASDMCSLSCDLGAMGHFLQDIHFRNRVINAFVAAETLVDAGIFWTLLKKLDHLKAANCTLRTLILDCITRSKPEFATLHMDKIGLELMTELFVHLCKHGKVVRKASTAYHEVDTEWELLGSVTSA